MNWTPDDLESARKLFAGPCDFVKGVAGIDGLPQSDLPELAFAGRSNVGKSSLVNALTGRKTLAKTSNTPGRTQQLNYFNLGGVLHLVDMPGYGYAKVSKTQKEEWNALIHDYLRSCGNLRCVLILVDSRHGLKDTDIELMDMLDETAVSYRVVLTKVDKADKKTLEKISTDIQAELKARAAGIPEITQTSAEEKTGLEELRAVIAAYRY